MDEVASSRGFLAKGQVVEWLQHFVRFPSEQTALLEKDPQVLRFIRDCAAPIARQIGGGCRIDLMGNLIVEFGPASHDSLLFVTYAMTHPAGRMIDPFAATLVQAQKGEAVRGRGVAEQKSALAACFAAAAEAVRQGLLKRRLSILLLTAGETGRHDALAAALPLLECQPKLAIVCIGTDNRIAIGNKGRIDLDVLVHGRTAHSSVPWQGINAITGAQQILALLASFGLWNAEHPQFGAATLTPTAIESAPKATHTVPDEVRITYDRRLLPGEDPDAAYREICERTVLPGPWKVEIARGPIMYPNEMPPESLLVRKLQRAFAAAGQPEPEQFYCNFALDAGYLSRSGIEAVMLGPGEVDQFHSNEETVLISDLVAMSNVYYRMIEQCLASNV
jgi:acetylornithine deacetylase